MPDHKDEFFNFFAPGVQNLSFEFLLVKEKKTICILGLFVFL